MKGLNKEKFFFFADDCSSIEIVPNSVEHAYLAIINDDLVSAKKIFLNIDSPRAKWGSIFVSILEGYLKDFPTYFQLRNFMEIDIDFLIKNEKINYIEQFLGALDILATINQETYKFIGRVMFENKLYTASLKYLEKAKQIYYNDPELHFLLAKYYLQAHNKQEALFYINECLKLLPNYFPALNIKQRIEENSI